MIYIDRNSVSKPKFFQSAPVLQLIQLTEDHYRDSKHIHNRIKPKNFLQIPDTVIGLDLIITLTELFNNKCAFCESLLISDVLVEMRKTLMGTGLKRRSIYKHSKDEVSQLGQLNKRYSQLEARWQEESNDSVMGGYFTAFDKLLLTECSKTSFTEFRPENWAKDDYGRSSFEHYWWLAFEWENFYLCCESCGNQKGDRFPVKGERISRGQDTSEENALLIDPCKKEDFQEEDISFNGPRAIPLTEYGEATIEIVGLNRTGLMANRAMAIQFAMTKIENFLNKKEHKYYASGDLFSPGQPYLSAIISNARINFSSEDFDHLMDVMPCHHGQSIRKEKLVKNAKTLTKAYLKEKVDHYYSNTRSYSLDDLVKTTHESESTDRLAYFRSSKWIGKVEIENFKNIRKLTLEFPKNILKDEETRESRHPWLMLLGENGVGKSSVLQAVAMTLMGEMRLNEFEFDAEEYVTRGGPVKSITKVYLTDRPDPIILTIDKESKSFKLNEPEPQIIMMGYGATRLLTKDKDRGFKKDFIRIKNLFDPFEQLDNVQDWLRDPDNVDDDLFDAISVSLMDLLMLKATSSNRRFIREHQNGKWQILFEKNIGELVPLNFLSSGYKAVIALALDIMVGLFQIYGDGDKRTRLQEAEGTVLIDEIGVHLHPQWKMWIVGALRRTFPKMNFLVTTHEPLCLRGLEKGEVFVVQHDDQNGINIKTELPSPKDLRVDQLLTSSFFGLNSVLDPILERKFDRYYELQAMGNNLTADQMKEMDDLEAKVLQHNVMLGSSVKEELEYKVIKEKFDHFSQKENNIKSEDVEKEIIVELKAKWDEALFD